MGPGGQPMGPQPGAGQPRPQPQPEQQAPTEIARPAGDQWITQVKFRLGCLELLGKGPDKEVSAVLQSGGALDSRSLGPIAAYMVHKRSNGWNAAEQLKRQFEATGNAEGQRAVIAVARAVGTEPCQQMLEDIILSQTAAVRRAAQEAAQDDRGGAAGGQPAGGAEAAPKQKAVKIETVQAIARAMGSLGQHKSLRKVLIYRMAERRLVFKYSADVREATLVGYAYLPEAEEPREKLEKMPVLPDEDYKTSIERALLEAFRIQSRRNKKPDAGDAA